MKMLSHPNIVQIMQCFVDQQDIWIVMPLLAGIKMFYILFKPINTIVIIIFNTQLINCFPLLDERICHQYNASCISQGFEGYCSDSHDFT